MKKLTAYGLLLTAIIITYHILLITPSYAASASSPSQTREEQSISNFKQGLLPEELRSEKRLQEQSALDQVFNALKNIPGFFLKIFKEEPLKKGTFLAESEDMHQSSFPPEIKPKSEDNHLFDFNWLGDQFKGLLGSFAGLYGADLPKFDKSLEKVSDYEKGYEQANFPEGINPITGQ